MTVYYDDLFRLCGFEDDEMGKERLRVEKVLTKLELGPAEMRTARDWVRQNHDVSLVGVRKLLGAWLKELIDLVLAKDEGKKVVYFSFPSIQGPGMAIKAADPEGIYCACPDMVLCHTMGQIFNKLIPILEAGEENGLPPGHGLCSLQQIRVGGLAKGIIPMPDLIIGQSYYCDYGAKVDELLHEKYGHPVAYVDGCKDSKWGEYPAYLPERIKFLGEQLNKFFDKVNETLEVEVTSDAWGKAMAASRLLFSGLGRLTQLMTADPMPVSGVETALALNLSAASTGRAMVEGPEAVSILCEEVEKRVESGIGIIKKGAPRILTLFPAISDASLIHMMEEVGLAVSATLLSVPLPKASQRIPYATPTEVRAEAEMRAGLYHSSFAIAKRFEDVAKTLKVDGVIWGYQHSCRPNAAGSHTIKKWVEENTGLPTLSLEMDFFDSRYYSAGALRTRVEAFADMLRARQASAGDRR